VTISTNMAGRGTDIVLGGNPEFLAKRKVDPDEEPESYQKSFQEYQEICRQDRDKVLAAGGLYVLGTERHESRRIDNQLRGRSGRQGDPGKSRFYLSLEDDLLRIFGSERISRMMDRLGISEYEPITHPWITKAIANAQKKVEGHNFEIRKNLLEYDDVMNQQRQTVYQMRRTILESEDIKEILYDSIDYMVADTVDTLVPAKIERDGFDTSSLDERSLGLFGWCPNYGEFNGQELNRDVIGRYLYDRAVKTYGEREGEYGVELLNHVGKVLALSTLDGLWKDHLLAMDHLREGIGLRGYGQRDPLMEYKREGLAIFQAMLGRFHADLVEKAYHVQITQKEEAALAQPEAEQPMALGRGGMPGMPAAERPEAHAAQAGTVTRQVAKVGRNDPCPCGSGKKYKKCHGA
jgi:preprotein translocase subunit SecA